MTDSVEYHDRVKQLFAEALQRETNERGQYLVESCGDDVELRQKVESLLRNYDEAQDEEFLNQPALPMDELAETAKYQKSESEMSKPHESQIEIPERIGQYKVEKVLGQGRFGVVYLAFDEIAKRRVAIKVPHGELIKTLEDVEAYLAEARIVAGLDHPNIVPVYHVDRTEDGSCYVVSKNIEGGNLKTRIEKDPPTREQTIEIVAAIAEALHVAHTIGLVHRDVKPANILLDESGKPYITDFGLAIHEDHQRLLSGQIAGAPAYMSPEQVRGESHRLDGRSDIWSLGVILYELLTGRRPFGGETLNELFDEIENRQHKPLRMIDDSIPRELEPIVSKCLSESVRERYETAQDLAGELRLTLDTSSIEEEERNAQKSTVASTPSRQNSEGVHLPFSSKDLISTPSKLIHERIGPYVLHNLIAAGGNGVVFLARNTNLGQEVCLKVSYPFQLDSTKIMAAMSRGMRGLAALNHPQIARVHDFGHLHLRNGSSFYIVMEHIPGENLSAWTHKRPEPTAFVERLRAARLITEALRAAHECTYFDNVGFQVRSVLHGDIKPTNVVVRPNDSPVMIDFMLVDVQRLLEREDSLHSSQSVTEDDQLSLMFGTPGFMAPEQEKEGFVTVKTDIYGLGMTLCHTFFPTEDPLWTLSQENRGEPLSRIQELLQEMIDPDPDRRPDDMSAVAVALDRIAESIPRESNVPVRDDYQDGTDIGDQLVDLHPVPDKKRPPRDESHRIVNDSGGRVQVGSVIQGRYRLDTTTGEGGLGTYYQATDLRFGATVTVWIGQKALGDDPDTRERFLSGLREIASFRHPGFVEHIGYDILDDGRPVLVMQHISGVKLSELDRPLSNREIQEFVAQVSLALQSAHEQGLVHLDLQPANIMVVDSESPPRFIVLHLGVAGLGSLGFDWGADFDEEPDATMTMLPLWNVSGTPLYLSPEQLMGQAHTPAVDIYQFGTILYELLAGRPPFAEASRGAWELMNAIQEMPPPRISDVAPKRDVPEAAEAVVLECLAKDPAARPVSMRDVADRFLAAWEGGSPELPESHALDNNVQFTEVARQIQSPFVPEQRPKLDGYEFYDYYAAVQNAGGDYLDYIALSENHVAVAVGDIAGKGLPWAALLMSRLFASARFHLTTMSTVAEALTGLNAETAAREMGHRFVTYVITVLRGSAGVEELVKRIVADVEHFCAGRPQRDDMCVVCFQRCE